MIGIVDYGMGNLRSVEKALGRVGGDPGVIRSPAEIDSADKLVVPGVGAFGDAMANLRERRLVDPIRRFAASGRPFLGVCLGMQLLFEASEEDGEHEGLGVIPGRVIRFRPDDPALKVPHMGWNTLAWAAPATAPANGDNPLMRGLTAGCSVYFVHSYYAAAADPADVAAITEYAGPFCSAVRHENIFATQFHPEKSQRVGLTMLANFAAL